MSPSKLAYKCAYQEEPMAFHELISIRVLIRMILESTANITRSQRTGTRGAVFCPKDEKNITPSIIGSSKIPNR